MPRFNPAPGWPTAPAGWTPGPDWRPDPAWPEAPAGWQYLVEDEVEAQAAPSSTPAPSRAAAALKKLRTATGNSSATGAGFGEGDDVTSDDLLWEGNSKTITGVGGGRYKLTRYYLHFEKGVLSTKGQQIAIEKITDVDHKQSLPQKARGVSDLHLHADDLSETAILESITDARDVQQLINEAARARRHELQRRSRQLAHPIYTQQTTPPVTPPTPASSTVAPGLIEKLQQLADLHAAGALTAEEFTAAKKQALGL
ncbi:SHOCT domain-containing protein [Pseudoclavibacter sp. 8L]|uniref:SHOCT domain-containing protein n=1 Tax=Pseudoclavibacter sp. 8L TaxID=2653162 RepID=UPI0012F3B795|nr:PH domain-containing protein [Pseudoclavibacter sp. 8L]VXB74116.1 putative Short C-terminal domain-containing protein [Pseudoclavibacter sp. 8L]